MTKTLLCLLLVTLGLQTAHAACPPAPQEPPDAARLQALQAQARDHGLLWRISKGGRSAYLYGSIHVGKMEWAVPGPEVTAALRASDTLALELDPADPALAQELAARSAQGTPPDAALRQRLARQVAAACLPEGALDSLHPLMQALTLTILNARWEGLDPGYAQEFVLSGWARSQGWPVLALETATQQLDALLPADPVEARRMLDEMLDQLEQDRVRPVLRRLSQSWASGDLDDLNGYERWCDCAQTEEDRAFLRRINDGRNPNLANRIVTIFETNHKLFAAVGALHLIGPRGLPALLRERGFVVERVAMQH